MKKNNSQNDSLNFDYSRIKEEVSENIREQMPQQTPETKRKPLWKRVMLATAYTLLVVAIAATSTWGIQKAFASENVRFIYVKGKESQDTILSGAAGAPTPSWKRNEIMDKFDRYICFGRMTSTELMGSFLLSEEDKDFINHAVEHSLQEMSLGLPVGSPLYLTVSLGEIDGEDYVYIEVYDGNFAFGCEQCESIFPSNGMFLSNIFKSNLGYSLNDVVTAFEKMIGEPLTDKYLRAVESENWGSAPGYAEASTGINMNFIENDSWSLRLLYDAADKYQWEIRTVKYFEKGDFSNAKVVQMENGIYKVTREGTYTDLDSFVENIISMDENGLLYSCERTYLSCYSEIFYTLYNGQLYVVNRAFMLTGEMYHHR